MRTSERGDTPMASVAWSWRVTAIVLVVAAVATLGYVAVLVRNASESKPREEADFRAPVPALSPYCERLVGEPEAPLQVVALLPVATGCQDVLGLFPVDVASRFGNRINVRILDMRGDNGRQTMERQALRCAAVLINGSTRFDLGHNGGKVLLEGPMDPLDVYHVLCAELRALDDSGTAAELPKPPPMPDFDVGQRQ